MAKLVNCPTISYILGSGVESEGVEQNKSLIRLRDFAKVLDDKCGGNTHVETVKMMNLWHLFGYHLLMRNRSNVFHKIETGHFMSKGIVPQVPGNLVLNNLPNMWIEPSFIGKEAQISSVLKLEQQRSPNLHGQSTSIEPWEYLNIRLQSIMIDNQIPGTNENLRMMKERNDQWCRMYFGSKYHILKGTFPVKNNVGQDCGTDNLMHNI